jgi:hypothetical protein
VLIRKSWSSLVCCSASTGAVRGTRSGGSPVRSVFSLPGVRRASPPTAPARPRPRSARQMPP